MTPEMQRALAALPHGPEFRFISRLVSLEPGLQGRAEYHLPEQAEFFKGHFPGEPLFPGVLLLEAAAQLAGIVAQSDPKQIPLAGLKLTAIRSAKIFGTARPGQILCLEARIAGRMGNLIQAFASITCEGRILLEASVVLSGGAPAPESKGH